MSSIEEVLPLAFLAFSLGLPEHVLGNGGAGPEQRFRRASSSAKHGVRPLIRLPASGQLSLMNHIDP